MKRLIVQRKIMFDCCSEQKNLYIEKHFLLPLKNNFVFAIILLTYKLLKESILLLVKNS